MEEVKIKPAYKLKTVWFNAMAVILALATVLPSDEFGSVISLLPVEAQKWFAVFLPVAIAVINAIIYIRTRPFRGEQENGEISSH